MGTRIMVSYALTGTFDPDAVTRFSGISPTKIWRYGDPISNTALTRKHDGWILSTAEKASHDLNERVQEMLSQLHHHADKLRDICRTLELDAEIACVVYVDEEQVPALHLDREIIRQVADLDAEVDIDLYQLQ